MDGVPHPSDVLTNRELEILRLVALGLSNRDIAEELVIALETVKWYNRQIYSKLNVSGRVQALNRARELGVLQVGMRITAASTAIMTKSLHNFPVPVTHFIGRTREIAEVKQLLSASRLLTLTGVGGTGKTRLAIRVASEVADNFADGVYFIDLAPLSNHSLVAKAIADALGVIENSAESLVNTLKRVLAGRQLLLVIDNFEHVIEAAPLVSGMLVSPHLKVLVTSRQALRISGEQDYPVLPLSLVPSDSPGNLVESEAAALFVQCAMMKLPHFKVTGDNAPAIAQICTRLDGLPLAIELAAARCNLLTPQALLARLDSRLVTLTGGSRDAPPRQQTLRRTFDWSYNLLDEGEKQLFARLAVFRGSRSLEAIESIGGQDLPIDMFDGLASLVDKSLIQQKEAPGGEPRFVMLEILHEYARERLAASGELETIRRRHAEYFVELAERAEPELWLAQQERWFQILEREHDNLRVVLDWSLEGDVAVGLRMAGVLWYFWHAYGHHVEGYQWTQQLLPRMGEAPVIYHAKFLFTAGHMSLRQFDLPASRRLFRESLDISRKLGDKRQTAWALTCMSQTHFEEMDKAYALAEEGLSLFRALDYEPGVQYSVLLLGEIARVNGDDRRARSAYEEALAMARHMDAIRQTLMAFANLSFINQHEGNHKSVIDLMRQALTRVRHMKNNKDMANFVQILAGSLGAVGEPEQAARLFGAAGVALERRGTFILTDQPELDRMIAAVRAQLDDVTFEAAWAEGRRMTLEQAVADALDE